MDQPDIEIRDLRKSFGRNNVLRGVTLDVRKGESFALIGGSGVGKSVVLKCILGLIKPDDGQVLVRGSNPVGRARNRSEAKIGMLFQGGALFDSMPVWQNVSFRQLRGPNRLQKSQAREVALNLLGRVGLESDVADRYPSELSGGMQKRASLARAIAEDPDIILFDEPTTGLDPVSASRISQLIRRIVEESGATALTITHDMVCVRRISDRIAMLHEGVIKWSGSTEALETAEYPFLRQFVQSGFDEFDDPTAAAE